MSRWIHRSAACAVIAAVAASCEPPPSIAEVVLVGRGTSHQVRQGAGPISLEVTGANLKWVIGASLGNDLSATFRSGPADGGITVDAVIAHGVSTGPRQLSLSMAEGRPTQNWPVAIDVTTIRTGPSGSDTLGFGTIDAPYRTASHALNLSDTGDQVDLGNGLYDVAAGEQWGTLANVPNGIVLRGASSAQATLDGAGAAGTPTALVFAGGGQVSGLTIRNFHRGLVATSGVVVADDLVIRNCNAEGATVSGAAVLHLTSSEIFDAGTAVFVSNSAQADISDARLHNNQIAMEVRDGAKAAVADSFLEKSTQVGLYATHTSDVTIDATAIDQNGTGAAIGSSGVYALDTAKVTIRGSGIRNNKGLGFFAGGGIISVTGGPIGLNGLGGVRLQGAQQVVLDTVQVQNNTGIGVHVVDTAAATTILDVKNATISSNSSSGLVVENGATTVRASTISANGGHATQVLLNAGLSLWWDPTDAQVNALSVANAGTQFCVSDERNAPTGSSVSVKTTTTLQGDTLTPGLVQGVNQQPPYWRITGAGNQISFVP